MDWIVDTSKLPASVVSHCTGRKMVALAFPGNVFCVVTEWTPDQQRQGWRGRRFGEPGPGGEFVIWAKSL